MIDLCEERMQINHRLHTQSAVKLSIYCVHSKLAPEEEMLCSCHVVITVCDEWGGAESRGNGARPVEVNDDERHLHHSPVSSPHGGAPEG